MSSTVVVGCCSMAQVGAAPQRLTLHMRSSSTGRCEVIPSSTSQAQLCSSWAALVTSGLLAPGSAAHLADGLQQHRQMQ